MNPGLEETIKDTVRDVLSPEEQVDAITDAVIAKLQDAALDEIATEEELDEWATSNGYVKAE